MFDHLLSSELATVFRLPASDWEVAVDKRKDPIGGGRMVIVAVRHRASGRKLTDSVAGRLSKRELNDHAEKLVRKLSEQLGYRPDTKKKRR